MHHLKENRRVERVVNGLAMGEPEWVFDTVDTAAQRALVRAVLDEYRHRAEPSPRSCVDQVLQIPLEQVTWRRYWRGFLWGLVVGILLTLLTLHELALLLRLFV